MCWWLVWNTPWLRLSLNPFENQVYFHNMKAIASNGMEIKTS